MRSNTHTHTLFQAHSELFFMQMEYNLFFRSVVRCFVSSLLIVLSQGFRVHIGVWCAVFACVFHVHIGNIGTRFTRIQCNKTNGYSSSFWTAFA